MFGLSFSILTGAFLGYATVFGWAEILKTPHETLMAWENRWPFSAYKDSHIFLIEVLAKVKCIDVIKIKPSFVS